MLKRLFAILVAATALLSFWHQLPPEWREHTVDTVSETSLHVVRVGLKLLFETLSAAVS